MANKKSKKRDLGSIVRTKEEAGLLSEQIAAKSMAAVNAYILTGLQVLRTEFKFSQEDLDKWTTAVAVLGGKNLEQVGGKPLVYDDNGTKDRLPSKPKNPL